MNRSGVTADGRCFRCVQRKRWAEEAVEWDDGEPRHLIDSFGRLCERPKRGRRPRDERMREYRNAYNDRKREADPAVFA